MIGLTFEKLRVNPEGMVAGLTSDMFATDGALELVRQGVPFREAYRRVGTGVGPS